MTEETWEETSEIVPSNQSIAEFTAMTIYLNAGRCTISQLTSALAILREQGRLPKTANPSALASDVWRRGLAKRKMRRQRR